MVRAADKSKSGGAETTQSTIPSFHKSPTPARYSLASPVSLRASSCYYGLEGRFTLKLGDWPIAGNKKYLLLVSRE